MSNKEEVVPTPKYWRDRADEARATAEQMRNPDAKEAMLQVAAIYERMARQAADKQNKST